MQRKRGNGLIAVGHVVSRETSVIERIRIDLDRKSPGEALAELVGMFDKMQRGWRMVAIEVEIEKGVAEYSSGGRMPLRRAKPGEFK